MKGEISFSTNGAPYFSLGQRPRFGPVGYAALKGRHRRCSALSGLGIHGDGGPRALPWANVFCPVGAEECGRMPRLVEALRKRFAKRAVLEKQVNQNMEGMGYGG